MKVLQTLPQHDLSLVGEAVKSAELEGYSMAMTMENRHDPFLALGVAAACSSSIELGTAVAIAFPRSPMVIANTSWDLQNSSQGRFVLGLGPQIKPHNERRFSIPWSPPVPRMREYIMALRAIWRCWETKTNLSFQGKHYSFTLMPPNFIPPSSGQPPIPVTIAAVGVHSLSLAGEICDGVRLHPFCTRAYMEDISLPIIDKSLRARGMARENFEVTGGGFIATGDNDKKVHESIEWVRQRVAFYGSTPGYWPVLEHHGYGDLGRKLNHMTKAGEWDLMANEIPDALLDLFVAAGRHDEIVKVIKSRFEGLADTIYATTAGDRPSNLTSELIQEIKHIPTNFVSYNGSW